MKIHAIKLMRATFVVLVALLITGSVLPLTPSESESLAQHYQNMESRVQSNTLLQNTIEIFSNNAFVALLSAIPILGPALSGLTMLQTGSLVKAFSPSFGEPSFVVAIELFVLPHGLLEFLAYSLAVLFGVEVVLTLGRRNWTAAKRLPKLLVSALAVLLFAAVIESAEISADELYPGLSVLAWAPVIIVAAKEHERLNKLLSQFDAVL